MGAPEYMILICDPDEDATDVAAVRSGPFPEPLTEVVGTPYYMAPEVMRGSYD